MKSTSETIAKRIGRASVGTLFETTDFTSLGRTAAETALSRMEARGDILRVRRGLYWKAPRSRFGTGVPSPVAVASKLCEGRGLGPTGWSARSALGLTTQVPVTPSLVVIGPPPTGVDGVRFSSRSNLRRIGLSYVEVALLEALREGLSADELDRVRRLIPELIAEKKLRWSRLAKAVQGEPLRVADSLASINPERANL